MLERGHFHVEGSSCSIHRRWLQNPCLTSEFLSVYFYVALNAIKTEHWGSVNEQAPAVRPQEYCYDPLYRIMK